MNAVRKEVIGNATLYCGDCLEILPTLATVDAVITDPPYGIGFAAQPTKGQRLAGHWPRYWDESPVKNLCELLEIGKTRVVWGGNYYSLPPCRGWLSWRKPDAPPSMASFELAWTNLDKNAREISCSISATNPERVGHPTQKPLAVMRFAFEYAGIPDVTIDPFMGSGSTGVVAILAGRQFIGIEIEPEYFDIACTRIENAQRQQRMFP